MLIEPPPSSGDLNFQVLGFPVRVHPLFWVVTIFFGLNLNDFGFLLAWVAAVFVAILVHELGHALVMRSFGFYPSIVLYAMGGLAIPGRGGSYRSRGYSPGAQIAISAAGPIAGFLLAALVLLAMDASGHRMELVDRVWNILPIYAPPQLSSPALAWFFDSIVYAGVFWGALNLLPIYPLDGGQIAREVFLQLSPRDGLRTSLIVSMLTAGGLAVVALTQWKSPYSALFFGYLAYNSYRLSKDF
jgi:stage IV sporulation protein FB